MANFAFNSFVTSRPRWIDREDAPRTSGAISLGANPKTGIPARMISAIGPGNEASRSPCAVQQLSSSASWLAIGRLNE